MDDTDAILSEDLDTDTQMDSTNGRESPRKRWRKKSSMIWNHCTEKIVDGIKYTCCKHCSSQWNLHGSTSTALQHIRLVHTDLITESELNNNTPTTPRAPIPTTENPGPSSAPSTPIRRGPKKSSMIWNHCTEKIVDGIKYTFCKHCSSQWNLNGSTSTALQHIRVVHSDLI